MNAGIHNAYFNKTYLMNIILQLLKPLTNQPQC